MVGSSSLESLLQLVPDNPEAAEAGADPYLDDDHVKHQGAELLFCYCSKSGVVV